ncbi:hypothetical protein ABT120_40680 [Nonomuraea angiospora]|uniref:hypothetical protein n=1 Tax=Nonomuraea angiospora TaxID=46172 RepID=UPI00331AB64A
MMSGESGTTALLPCGSDGWPFHGDPRMFEARRAVGQLVRTMGGMTNAPGPEVLDYIHAADSIASALQEEVLPELVAEARAGGVPWADIGRALRIDDTEAQRLFGNRPDPATAGMADQARQVVRQSNSLVAGDMASSEAAEFRSEVEGSAPVESLRHGMGLLVMAHLAFEDAEAECVPPAPNYDRFVKHLTTARDRVMGAMDALLFDPANWKAVSEWAGSVPLAPDTSHYAAPATYIYFAFRQVLLAGNYSTRALSPRVAFDERMDSFTLAKAHVQFAIHAMNRFDVLAALPPGLRSQAH